MDGYQAIMSRLIPQVGEVKVLGVGFDSPLYPLLSRLLSSDELAYAGSFRFERDRVGFVIQRGLWRLGASVLSGFSPQSVVVHRDEFGRPMIAERSPSMADLGDLNGSRTESYCSVVISGDQRCGIDIEDVTSMVPDSKLVEMLPSCGASKAQMLENPGIFYESWTQIEAVLKADGRGLADGLEAVEFVGQLGTGRSLWRIDEKTWTTVPISLPSGVVGTVAVERDATRVTQISGDEVVALLPTRILCA